MALLEAAHSEAGDLPTWAEGTAEAAAKLLRLPGVSMTVTVREPDRYRFVALAGHGLAGPADVQDMRVMDVLFRLRQVASTSELIRHLPEAFRAHWANYMQQIGMRDGGGVMGYVGRTSFALYGFSPVPLSLTSKDRALLHRVAAHVETGLELRLGGAKEVAVLRPDGRIEHAAGTASEAASRDRLTSHVRGVESARTRRRRASPDAIETWTALLEGRWGLVERIESDGKRYYVIVENAERASRYRALSPREARVLELSARGASGKSVAYALGVSDGSVSRALASAALKTGCHGRTEVVRVAALLLGATRDEKLEARLTAAEREVLALVRAGFSTMEIAAHRDTSARTVANQIASLLRKARVPSRRALAVR